jgi:7-cyano-7-deazaguanine synthase
MEKQPVIPLRSKMFSNTAPAPHKKSLVVLSGGLDSATCLGLAIKNAEQVAVVNFTYGQRHVREVQSALALCEHYGIAERYFLDTPAMQFLHRPYQYQGGPEPLLPPSWKPGRNMIFLAYATSLAYSIGATIIVGGMHQEDYPGYPDCREWFLRLAESCAIDALGTPLALWIPFLQKSKTEIVKMGLSLNVPYEKTWTCYEGGEEPCHVCDACVRRERAFKDNGTVDPLVKDKLDV